MKLVRYRFKTKSVDDYISGGDNHIRMESNDW